MIETITFKNESYPKFQSQGNAAKFALPFAMEVCKGVGFDIGCNRPEWAFPGAVKIDPVLNDWNAFNLPAYKVDYIFSSHCLEHLEKWTDALDNWYNHLKDGGVMFLYLPDFSQKYWRPWHNRKHVIAFTPEIIKAYFEDKGFKNIFCSGVDLNNSFMIMGEKEDLFADL
jgi:predicted SAM-dependent methyltransferase